MSAAPAVAPAVAPHHDLSPTLATFLDRHLILPMLDFTQSCKMYPDEDLLQTKLDLLSKTNMVDAAIETFQQLHPGSAAPAALVAQKESVVQRATQLQHQCGAILQLFEQPELMHRLRDDKMLTAQHLHDMYEISAAAIEALYPYAKFQFESGNYDDAVVYLYYYRLVTSHAERAFEALWGEFACNILLQRWETAIENIHRLRELIDQQSNTAPLVQLQQRSWLIHWSLYVFFNHTTGRTVMLDLFFQDKYQDKFLSTVQINCPHILRYLACAVITNKRRRTVVQRLVEVILQEKYTYHDPITELVECLYVNFDFEAAQEKLKQCEEVLNNDIFLAACHDEFVENARLFIFETFCRIHQCIDISMLSEKLQKPAAEAEEWIVNLIRNARIDAKIDSKANQVIMKAQHSSVYQQVLEVTKGLHFRSISMVNSLRKATTTAASAAATAAAASAAAASNAAAST